MTAAMTPQTGAEATAIRPSTHGKFEDGAAFTQAVVDLARQQVSWNKMTPGQREAFHMIIHKSHRILTGDPDVKEHWVDIEGYARLGGRGCTK